MTVYDTTFYDVIREGCRASAAEVVPLVLAGYYPATVIDVGCGEGWWAHEFATYDCDVVGVDGEYVMSSPLGDRFIAADLARPLPEMGVFDLAVSLEVAEHLPANRAAGFVADLCNLAPVVLFSAAVPGQGGTGHLNEQWPGYWVDLFNGHGYEVSGALRWQMWDNDRVENWYRANCLVATCDPAALPCWFATPLAPPWPVIHPVLYNARTGR